MQKGGDIWISWAGGWELAVASLHESVLLSSSKQWPRCRWEECRGFLDGREGSGEQSSREYWWMCVLSQSVMSHSAAHGLYPVRLFCPWGFSRQEYWSGLPYSPPGDLPNPEIKPRSPTLQVDSLPSEPPGKPKNNGVGSLSLLQANFLTQKLNQGLLHCRQIPYQLSYPGSPKQG